MKTKITSQNCLYQDKKKGILIIFVCLTLYFLSQLSGIYLNDVRANIKIKKKRKINQLNSVALLGHGTAEVEERKKGEGKEEGEFERGGNEVGGMRSVRWWGEGLKLLAVGGIVSLGLVLYVLHYLFILFFTCWRNNMVTNKQITVVSDCSV